jgi:hypothetical protein
MKKPILLLLFVWIGTSAFAQQKFKKGYFVDANGKKVQALIQNEKWTENPESFNYKFADHGRVTTVTLQEAKEFSIYNRFKYRKVTFTLDNASDNEENLSTEKTPQYQTKTAFLKVMVEGNEVSLFEYKSKDQQRFFYQKGLRDVTLLRYNKYKKSNGEIAENNAFRKQLSEDVMTSCASIDISYTKAKLGNYVIAYNNCSKIDKRLIDFREFELRRDWRFKVKAGVNIASFDVINRSGGNSGEGNGTSMRIGFEIEHFLQFKNKNWSVFAEPTYSSLTSDEVSLEYNSLEIPIGLRNYIRVSQKSFAFLNAGVSLDMSGSSTAGNTGLDTGIAIFYGAGYSFDKKFSLEVRNYTNRRLAPQDTNLLEADQTANLAIVLGYTF